MAAIPITYKVVTSSPVLGSRFALYDNVVDLTIGDGVGVYAAGGVVIDKSQLGLPQQQIERFSVLEQTGAPTSAPIPNYDPINNKLQFFVVSAAGVNQPVTEATVAFAPTAFTLRCEVRGF